MTHFLKNNISEFLNVLCCKGWKILEMKLSWVFIKKKKRMLDFREDIYTVYKKMSLDNWPIVLEYICIFVHYQ